MGDGEREHGTAEGERGTGDAERVTGHTVGEAAAILGVSERAVRARIRRGTLEATTVQGARGMEYRVTLPPAGEEGTGHGERTGNAERKAEPAAAPPAADDARLQDLIDQVAWLRGQVEAREREASEMREHATELARLLEREQHARAALEARQVLALPPAAAIEPAEPVEQPKKRRRWWFW